METKRIYIGDLSKAAVLAALFNAIQNEKSMDADEATQILESTNLIGKLHEATLNVKIDGDWLDPTEYDRLHGQNKADDALLNLRGDNIRKLHKLGIDEML